LPHFSLRKLFLIDLSDLIINPNPEQKRQYDSPDGILTFPGCKPEPSQNEQISHEKSFIPDFLAYFPEPSHSWQYFLPGGQ
jgi:hypothetical protein